MRTCAHEPGPTDVIKAEGVQRQPHICVQRQPVLRRVPFLLVTQSTLLARLAVIRDRIPCVLAGILHGQAPLYCLVQLSLQGVLTTATHKVAFKHCLCWPTYRRYLSYAIVSAQKSPNAGCWFAQKSPNAGCWFAQKRASSVVPPPSTNTVECFSHFVCTALLHTQIAAGQIFEQ